MAKKITLVLADEEYKQLEEAAKEVAAAGDPIRLSRTVANGIKILQWMLRQKREGFVVRAQKEEGDKVVVREVST